MKKSNLFKQIALNSVLIKNGIKPKLSFILIQNAAFSAD